MTCDNVYEICGWGEVVIEHKSTSKIKQEFKFNFKIRMFCVLCESILHHEGLNEQWSIKTKVSETHILEQWIEVKSLSEHSEDK